MFGYTLAKTIVLLTLVEYIFTTSSNYLSPLIMGSSRTPVYFLSIGGPNTIENTNHPAYLQLQQVGHEIVSQVKPEAVIVFSAHWQDNVDNRVQINTAEETQLIYDFSGFPESYYEIKYPSRGSPDLAAKVMKLLTDAGIRAQGVTRGLDHGVWVGFRAGQYCTVVVPSEPIFCTLNNYVS